MILIDSKKKRLEIKIGEAITGRECEEIIITQNEIDNFISNGGDWENYRDCILKTRFLRDDQEIEIIKKVGRESGVMFGSSD